MSISTLDQSQTATPSQRISFLSKLTEFGKKVGALRSVVKDAIQHFPGSDYERVEAEIASSVGSSGASSAKTPWTRWLSSVTQAFRESTGSLFVAGEKLRTSVLELHRIGFHVGSKLERETENPKVSEQLVSKLVDSGLYRPGQGSQLNLLNNELVITKETIKTPVGKMEGTVAEVLRLTRQMDSLLYLDPDQRTKLRTTLDNNDGQTAFHLRDRLSGLIKSYGELKKSGAPVSSDLKKLLSDNGEELNRACAYAAWSKDLKEALGIS